MCIYFLLFGISAEAHAFKGVGYAGVSVAFVLYLLWNPENAGARGRRVAQILVSRVSPVLLFAAGVMMGSIVVLDVFFFPSGVTYYEMLSKCACTALSGAAVLLLLLQRPIGGPTTQSRR